MVRKAAISSFQETVQQHYALYGRHDLPWRLPEHGGTFDPYKILVSEIMLQQTQVSRVIPKYQEFLKRFPDVETLARAPLGDVLRVWNGLGYNRRAKFLWQAARTVQHEFGGVFPEQTSELTHLPGVGKNTAGAVAAYAFDKPAVFIETNIRTAFIYHFFLDRTAVSDSEILALVGAALPAEGDGQYREWYWALMDYGSFLKQSAKNLNKLSKSYNKQSPFEGSRRQVRGKVIRLLSKKPHSKAALGREIADERLESVLSDLVNEGLIVKAGGMYDLHSREA